MNIQVAIHPTATTRGQSSLVQIDCEGDRSTLDVNFAQLLNSISLPAPLALDLLFIASCVYGIDKTVSRDRFAEDRWTRHLDIRLPVLEPDAWHAVADDLADCLNFLTGDWWSFTFEKATRALVQRRRVRRRRRNRYTSRLVGDVVSLFSGGLDSYIGAIDILAERSDIEVALVGHYDGDIGGPGKDQDELADWLEEAFPDRFTRLKCRIGISEKAAEHSYRSRSFLFLALGIAAAHSIGENVPVIIPENGPIALNLPLIPSRRGACSTRTTHPHFLSSLQAILQTVGLRHDIVNPYKLHTKGEMILNCQDRDLLAQSYAASRSCAKFGRKTHWRDTTARQCGVCIPCMFRRAALYTKDWDNEHFGLNIGDNAISPVTLATDAFADIRAISSFLHRNDTAEAISRDVALSGPIQPEHLNDYVSVIIRMREEVRNWMTDKANDLIRQESGLQKA